MELLLDHVDDRVVKLKALGKVSLVQSRGDTNSEASSQHKREALLLKLNNFEADFDTDLAFWQIHFEKTL